jgi:hypothetical protein
MVYNLMGKRGGQTGMNYLIIPLPTPKKKKKS